MPIRSASKDGTFCGHLNCKLILLLESSLKYLTKFSPCMREGVYVCW